MGPFVDNKPSHEIRDSDQPLRVIMDNISSGNKLPSLTLQNENTSTNRETEVPFVDQQSQDIINLEQNIKEAPDTTLSSHLDLQRRGSTDVSILQIGKLSSSKPSISTDIPKPPAMDLEYCLVILYKLINPLTNEKHIKPLLEDLMDSVPDAERRKLARRIADPELGQSEKQKLLTEFKTFDGGLEVETGKISYQEVQFQSIPCQIIP